MRSFALACLMAASASAVSLTSHPWAIGDVEEILNGGGLVPLSTIGDKMIVLDTKGEDAEDNEEKSVKSGVMKQVLSGFDSLLSDNNVLEGVATGLIQEAQNLEVSEIIKNANSAAQIAIKVGSPDQAGSLVDSIFKEEGGLLAASNKKHDAAIADIAKESVASTISNEAVKNNLLYDIVNAPEDPVEISHVVADANLPFPVDTGVAIVKDGQVADKKEIATKTLEKIVKESGTDVAAMKENPMFDGFLKQIMFNFDDLIATPERPESHGFDVDDDLIAAPERPDKPGFDVDEDLIARPERPEGMNADLGKDIIDRPERPESPGFDVDEDLIERPEAPEAPENDVDEDDWENPGKQGAPAGLLDFERLENDFDLDSEINMIDGGISKMDLDLPSFHFVRPGRPGAPGRPDMGRLDTDAPDTSYGDFARPGRPSAPGRPDMGRLDTDAPDTSYGDFARPGRPSAPGRPDMGRLDTDAPDTSYGDFERPGRPEFEGFSYSVGDIIPRGAPEREEFVLHVPERDERPAREAHVPSDRTRKPRIEREPHVPSDRTRSERKAREAHVPSDRTRAERPAREAHVPSDRTRKPRPERPAHVAYVPEPRTKPERKVISIAHPMRREIIDDDMLVQHGQAFW